LPLRQRQKIQEVPRAVGAIHASPLLGGGLARPQEGKRMSRKRYEEEIEEILEKLDGTLPSQPLTKRLRGRLQNLIGHLGQALTSTLGVVQPGHVMLLSLALMLAAYLLPLPFDWKRDLGILGLVLFFMAFVVSLLERRRTRYEPRWRGRVIRYEAGVRWPDWLRRLFGRR